MRTGALLRQHARQSLRVNTAWIRVGAVATMRSSPSGSCCGARSLADGIRIMRLESRI